MSIPANDAFSLSPHSASRSKTLSRSPPPSYAFLPHSHSHSSTTHHVYAPKIDSVQTQGMSLRQRKLSSGSAPTANGHAAPNGEHAPPETEPKFEPPRHDHETNGKSVVGKAKAVRPPIDWEIPRKVFHSSIGILVIPLYTHHIAATDVARVLSVACAVITAVDFVRLRSPRFAVIYERCLGFLMRESEKQKTNGVIWYLLGCIFVLFLYPEDIATVSILTLSWCDTSASTFGRAFGYLTPPLPQSLPIPFTSIRLPLPFARRKSTAGFLAGSITGALIVFGFWSFIAPLGAGPTSLPDAIVLDGQTLAFLPLALLASVAGILAGVAEAIDIGSLDDNLTLPIISGGVLWTLFKAIDYFSFSREQLFASLSLRHP